MMVVRQPWNAGVIGIVAVVPPDIALGLCISVSVPYDVVCHLIVLAMIDGVLHIRSIPRLFHRVQRRADDALC